jgi:hypothetical protein
MPICNFRFGQNRLNGPRVPLVVNVHPAFIKPIQDAGKSLPAPVTGIGLIDTGASYTSIDIGAAKAMGLPETGNRLLGTAGGPQQFPVYPFALSVTGLPQLVCPTGNGLQSCGPGHYCADRNGYPRALRPYHQRPR